MRAEQEWERCKTIQKWRDGASIPRAALGLGRKSLEGQGTQHVPTPLTQQRGLGGGYALLGADRLAARWSERTPRPCPHSVGNDSTWEDSGCQGQRVRPRGTYSTAAAAVLGNQGRKMWALKWPRGTVTKAGRGGHGDPRRPSEMRWEDSSVEAPRTGILGSRGSTGRPWRLLDEWKWRQRPLRTPLVLWVLPPASTSSRLLW